MTSEQINQRLTELQTEMDSVLSTFNAKKAEVDKMNIEWQNFGSKCQMRVTHLEGCITEAKRFKAELFPEVPPAEPPPV